MKRNKRELTEVIERKILQFIYDTKTLQEIYNYTNEIYEIPRSLCSDYITMRISLSEASEFILYCLLDSIEKIRSESSVIEDFYTEKEIKFYSKSKYEVDKIKFPLIFKMIQVKHDQWIGQISIKKMMELRNAQLINYNTNAQRTMNKTVKGNKEIYKIALNTKSINEIEKLYKKETYISTPFTLNIPQDTDYNFYYDKENCELVIKDLEHFDINDGYHRYIAACKIYDIDPEFDYQMELRIVNWSDDKAKQFIYQEDQKTKMKKVDSDSLNMNRAANIVAERVNESPKCNLQGMINRNEGIVNLGDFAELIDYFYFKNAKKDEEKAITIEAIRDIIENINLLTEYDIKYLRERYSFKQLIAIMFLFNYYKSNKEKILPIIENFIQEVNNIDIRKFYNKKPSKILISDLEKIAKEME